MVLSIDTDIVNILCVIRYDSTFWFPVRSLERRILLNMSENILFFDGSERCN